MKPTRILYGGSFDPPTMAHRFLVDTALRAYEGTDGLEVVVIPAGTAPHKRDRETTAAEHRLGMCRAAFDDLAPRVRISDEEIVRGGTSWTVDTLARHREELGDDAELCFLLGADSLLSFDKWREPQRILRLARILAVARPGFPLERLDQLEGLDASERAKLRSGILEGEGPDVSSTMLRARFAEGRAPGPSLLAPRVLDYIDRHGLYDRAT